MVSFGELWDVIENQKSISPLMDSGDDDRALSAVRSGMDLRKEDETPFWDDFISLCSNDGLADLLDVSKDKIARWPSIIREYLGKLESHDREDPNREDDTEVVPTGDNGAFIVPPSSNVDPNFGEI